MSCSTPSLTATAPVPSLLHGGSRNLRFVPRTEDALRNRKNPILTLNTLLRRKAYETGVHPFYIDAVSGNFARMIESIQSVEEINDLISYMVQSYCRLVEQSEA